MSSQSLEPPRPTARVRDPERKQKILEAAVTLVADQGFHGVSLAEIGAEAGIVGSGVYRHFANKAAILVELFEQVIDGLLSDERATVERETDVERVLEMLIDGQVAFVVERREIARVYHHEIGNVPEDDRRRLRRKQRLYLEEWVHILQELRPELDDAYARTLVHAAIGAIQSTLFHNVGLPDDRLRQALVNAARGALKA